jgi:HTH-type transcriptional regulator / antitoxin HigA
VKVETEKEFRLADLLPAWKGIRKKIPELGPIRNERAYARMKHLMDQLLEEVGDDEDHDLADLLDIVSTLVMQYEEQHHPEIPQVEPREILKFLMEQHDLRQSDLKKEIGSQGVVSEILSGNRELNTRQVRKLAKRFGISPAAFIGQ